MPNTTRELLINHYNAYPKLEVADIFKFIFQSAFGCEHLVSSEERALNYIIAELERIRDESSEPRVDALDGDYSRVHLSCIRDTLSAETLAKYFCLSAKTEPDGKARLLEKIAVARELVADGTIPLSLSEFDELHAVWEAAGYPAIHHSDSFREAYRPAYRVIANEYLKYII
jgi:hypothetical protein